MSNDDPGFTADLLVSAAEIGRLAGVTRAAVSNWRKRYADFPVPVGGGARNALFSLAEVRAWLDRQRKGNEVSGEVLLWQALRVVYGRDMMRGLADLGELFTVGPAESLDERVRSRAEELAGRTSPAEVLEGLTERLIGSARRGTAEHVSTPRMVRAIRHFAGSVTGTVFDPACGIGSLLLAFGGGSEVTLAGQEADAPAARFARSRAALAGRPEADIRVGDSLRDDRWPGLQASLVVCDPPASAPGWERTDLLLDSRWELGVPPRAEAELAWLQHCYAHTAPGGRVIFVMPPSAAYRKTGRRVRAELLRRGILTQVVALPAGMAASHAQPAHLWVLTRPGSSEDAVSSVTMTDLSDHDPDGPLEPGPTQTVQVPSIDLLDEVVDLTPARHVAASHTDFPAEYASLREDLERRLHELAALMPSLTAGTGLPGSTVSVAELTRAGLAEIADGEVISTSARLDIDYLHGFLRSAANTRRSTSDSGTYHLDVRGSRVPRMDIDDQRRYGIAFRAIEDFERHVKELTKLSERAASLAREGLTTGALRPAPDSDGEPQ